MTDGAFSEHLQCAPCTHGKYCDEASTISSAITCPLGYFCPAGTGDLLENACPAGTYSTGTGGIGRQISCGMCPITKYCTDAAENNTESCDAGYYCWKFTQDIYQTPILPGKSASSATGNYSNAADCPVGQYCPIHSSTPLDCPSGTYTSATGMGEIMNCGDCPAGYACPTAGSSTSGDFFACPAAHYCPSGTIDPFDHPCPAGYYDDSGSLEQSSDCTECPAGSACLERTSTTATTLTVNSVSQAVNGIQACAAGHYCPIRTEMPDQYPCPAGTYTTSTSLTAAASCTSCTAGKWCDEGSPDDSVDCPQNFYCPLGTTSPLP